MSGSRANVRRGWWGERIVLAHRNECARGRGWGLAVPLAPAFPADILDLQPSGPVFIEVKTTRQARFPALSQPELTFSEEVRAMGARYVVAVVTEKGPWRNGKPPAYSLSYSPVPRVGPRTGSRRSWGRTAALGPLAEPPPRLAPTTALDRALGTAGGSADSVADTTGGAMLSPPSQVRSDENSEDRQYHAEAKACDECTDYERCERGECRG